VSRAATLRAGAAAATALAVLASVGYVAAHPKYADAPLQPPVVRPSPTPTPTPKGGRIRLTPGVRETEVPAVIATHVS
jgi:hypothetical protein